MKLEYSRGTLNSSSTRQRLHGTVQFRLQATLNLLRIDPMESGFEWHCISERSTLLRQKMLPGQNHQMHEPAIDENKFVCV